MPQFVPTLQVPKIVTPPIAAKPAPTPVATTGDALTLDALMQRQKEIAASQQTEMGQPIASNEQGMAHLAWALVNGLRQRKAERELATGQREVAQAFQTGFDPKTGEMTPEAMGVLAARDPDLAAKFAIEAASARRTAAKEDVWTPIPTPQGENGQWFQNQHGDTKKVGGGSPGEGTWKPSDLGTLRDDYTQAAATYIQAAPSFQSMKEAAATATAPEGTTEGKGAADYNMIVAFAKLLDPNSVVREGEVKSAAMTEGDLGALQGWLNTWRKEGMLTDDIRRGIMTQANSRMKAYYDQAKTSRDWISGIATRHGQDPNDIVPPLPEFSGWEAAKQEDPNKQVVDELPDPANLQDGTTASGDDGSKWIVKGHKWERVP
jgi:hypothetical protein